jgi:rhamnose utilization protein RhaD (predicted bifunctional aldolase and dehydrogenase)/NAD(P)-dependent dehydrogenase (short-subunit alcohol dehydrogenase family)
MRDRWDEAEAAACEGELGRLAYAVRLFGQEETIAPLEGSSASVKMSVRDLLGEEEEILFIDSARHLPDSQEAGALVPLRSKRLARLVALETQAMAQLENEVACSRTQATSPIPATAAILHAALPYRCVLETQPDAVLAIGCATGGLERLARLYEGAVLVLPYAASGLALARACDKALKSVATGAPVGIVVLHQGLFTFGENVRLAYGRVVDLVTRAEQYLGLQRAWDLPTTPATQEGTPSGRELAALRQLVSASAGRPLILSVHGDQASLNFCRRDDLANLSQAGPAVAGQISLAGRVPMFGRDVEAYRASSERSTAVDGEGSPAPEQDAAPRIILDPVLGMCALGRTAAEAALAGRQYRHAINIILRANALEAYRAMSPEEAGKAEEAAWSGAAAAGRDETVLFEGEVALVTGGASGIGRACVASLLARGAAVVNLDINPSVETLFVRPDYLGLQCDLTDEKAILRSFEALARAFGGLDMLVLNAGIFPSSCRIESLTLEHWQKVMRINLDSNLVVMREAYGLLKHSPRGGRVVVNASKNVLAPGAGAAAYSASKAAVTQLARVAALEWGKDHIRINQVHPDAIFDTGIWTEDVLKARAAHYGMTVQQYKTRNVLGVELNSHVVGELVAEMLGPRFEKITGAQIPVDGGSDRVI